MTKSDNGAALSAETEKYWVQAVTPAKSTGSKSSAPSRASLRVPVPAFLDDPLLRLEVAVHDSEALLKALRPLEVVGERPQEIAAHVGARLHRAPDLRDKAPQEADAPLVVDLAVGVRPVAVRASVLGDVDRHCRDSPCAMRMIISDSACG